MKKLIPLLLIFCIACNDKSINYNSTEKTENIKTPEAVEQIDCDTILNNNHTFIVCQGRDTNIFILRDNDTIYKNPYWTNDYEVKDFNEDGYKDLMFHYISNYPLIETYLFDISHNDFKLVKNSGSCSESVKIKGTDFYYCYNRRGCADLNWDSDLYYIEDFEIHKIGNITGIGCERDDEEIKNGIYIYKTEKDSIQTLLQYIPREPSYYGDKWDFIEEYWSNNYQNFK